MKEVTALTVIDMRKSVKKQIAEDKNYLLDYFTEKQVKKIEEEISAIKENKRMKLVFVFAVKGLFRNKVMYKFLEKGE